MEVSPKDDRKCAALLGRIDKDRGGRRKWELRGVKESKWLNPCNGTYKGS